MNAQHLAARRIARVLEEASELAGLLEGGDPEAVRLLQLTLPLLRDAAAFNYSLMEPA